jgi:SAM-dependent methyltransferase
MHSLMRLLRFDRLPPEVAIQEAYQVVLGREPDPSAVATLLPELATGALSNRDLVDFLHGSSEFETRRAHSDRTLGSSLHASRCRFIRALPDANWIVDLGGTDLGDQRGALVSLGYPYDFEMLVVIDLPPEERHSTYRSDTYDVTDTEHGLVAYRYQSMTDLSGFDDASVDLVYAGQSIEHVTPEEGRVVMKEAFRILRPGGHFALDTPNSKVTRIQQADFIDPDHKVEYTWAELSGMLNSAGFEIEWRKGLNYGGDSVASGRFDPLEVASNRGLFDNIEDCYLLAVVASKPVS